MKETRPNTQEGASQIRTLEELMENSDIIKNAYNLAKKAHEGQTRVEGSPYFAAHCVPVARIIYEEFKITDPNIIAAALLHDTIEDTTIKFSDIDKGFGEKVASWVDGVSKLESNLETEKKLLERTYLDPVVAILKLADRLHNMRTLKFMPHDKQVKKAQETLDMYSPLAESLGLWTVKTELENIAFEYVDPTIFNKFSEVINKDPRLNNFFSINMITSLQNFLAEAGIRGVVKMRENSFVKLYDKSQKTLLSDINDLVSFRVIIDGGDRDESRNNCYAVLGIIREKLGEIEETDRFDDSYTQPKDNNYSAIHLTLKTNAGAVEVAITSKEKEEFNNWGVVSLIRNNVKELRDYALKLVITPSDEVKFLPPSATGVDFAYARGKDFGVRTEEILIDGVKYPISAVIPNGATVEAIVGESRIAPVQELENYALLPARKQIEKQRSLLERYKLEKSGKEMLSGHLQERGIIDLADILEFKKLEPILVGVLHKIGCKGILENLYYQIGSGRMRIEYLIEQLDKVPELTKEKLNFTSIWIEGQDEPGLLQLFTTRLAELNVNILKNHGGLDEEKHFIQRFVVEKLSDDQKNQLKEELTKDPRITKIIVA